jgi:hypothetical protein
MSGILLTLIGLVALVIWLGSLVCFVMVLIKLFQEKGALHGIMGLICGLYTFVWGWIHNARLGIKKIMMIWTVLLIVGMVLQGVATVFGMAAAGPQIRAEIEKQQRLQQQQQGR